MQQEDPNYGSPREEEPRVTRVPLDKTSTQDERTWPMLAHLSILLWIITWPLAFLFSITILLIPVALVLLVPVAPLVVWLIYKDRSPRVRFHAAQAFWYQVVWTVILSIGWIVTGILVFVIIGLLLIPVMGILSLVPFVHQCYAAYMVNRGVNYRYPIIADMIDGGQRFA